MRTKIIIGLVGVLALAFLSTGVFLVYRAVFCEEIKGRIMVKQRNAEVRRLALIKLYAVSAKSAESWRLKVVANCRRIYEESIDYSIKAAAERKTLVAENDNSISQLQRLFEVAVESRDTARELWIVNPNQPDKKKRFFEVVVMQGFPSAKYVEESALSSRWDLCYETLRKSVVPDLQDRLHKARLFKELELSRHDSAVRKKLSELKSEYQRSLSYDELTQIPESVPVAAVGISDDNGDYSLTVPVGDYYLIARASRTVFDTDEHYYWAKRVSVPSEESKRCLMGNHNMMGGSERNMWSDLEDLIREQREQK